jgi:hypothetical protein
MMLNGISRLDLIQDPGTGQDCGYYYKCVGATQIPFISDGVPILPRFYIWQPIEEPRECKKL